MSMWVVGIDGIDTETGKVRPRQVATFSSRRTQQHEDIEPGALPRVRRPLAEHAHMGRYAVGGAPGVVRRGGSIRLMVLTRSMDLSNEAITRTPVLSACATR